MYSPAAAPYPYLILVCPSNVKTHCIPWSSVCPKQLNPHLSFLGGEGDILKPKGCVLELLRIGIRYEGASIGMLYGIRSHRHNEIYDNSKLVACTVSACSAAADGFSDVQRCTVNEEIRALIGESNFLVDDILR